MLIQILKDQIMWKYFLYTILLASSISAEANPAYEYLPSIRNILAKNMTFLHNCLPGLFRNKFCDFRLLNDEILGEFKVEDLYRASSETGIYIDRKFTHVFDDVRLHINEFEIPIPDGDGIFFAPLPMGGDEKFNIKLSIPYSGVQPFDRDAEALIRSVILVKSNSHYVQGIFTQLPELKNNVEAAKQAYLNVKRSLRFLTLTKDNASKYLTSILGRDASDLSGHCLEPFPLTPEECSILNIIVSILKGETPGIGPEDLQKAFLGFSRSTSDLGQALSTLRSTQREYSDEFSRAYAEAYDLVMKETPR